MLKLIVGLGNPGPEYEQTRHNAGFWFVNAIADTYGAKFVSETKFKGQIAKVAIDGAPCVLLKPSTYMNLSGESVKALANFYKWSINEILIVHDELDLLPGTARLKFDGGHGGHNGLKSIIAHFHTKGFHRLRIGIGHPGHRDGVEKYVLQRPSRDDEQKIQDSISESLRVLPYLFAGKLQKAMLELHSATNSD